MAKCFWMCIFLMLCGFCEAQEVLVLENIKTEEKKEFKLPIAVTCKLDDGSEEAFMIVDIKDDSIITKKYYNNLNIRNYHINEILSIRFKKKSDWIVQSSFILFLTSTAIIIPFTFNDLNKKPQYAGEPPSFFANVFGMPLSFISFGMTIFLINKLPRQYTQKKWRFYVE